MKRPFLTLLTFFLFCFGAFSLKTAASSGAENQNIPIGVSPAVPLSESSYRDLDKLIGLGLIDRFVIGQKPYSRNEFARMIGEAIEHYSRVTDPLEKKNSSLEETHRALMRKVEIDHALNRLKKEFEQELINRGSLPGKTASIDLRGLHAMRFNFTGTNSPFRKVLPRNGLGSIDATVNPLLAYQEGRHFARGAQTSFQTEHWISLSPYANLYAVPRFQLQYSSQDHPEENGAFAQKLSARFGAKNVELLVGRETVAWGPGAHGGLLLSDNARPLDMLRVSNPSPSSLPGPLKSLGLLKYSLLVANMGPSFSFEDAYLAGWRLDWKPHRHLELGFSQLVYLGGEGSRGPSAGEAVLNTLGISNGSISRNRLLSADAVLTVPSWGGLQLYAEMLFDGSELSGRQTGVYAGLYLPRLNSSGTADLRVEFKRLGGAVYRDNTYLSGHALNELMLGDSLGPGAFGAYAFFNIDVSKNFTLKTDWAFERRSFALYGFPVGVPSPSDEDRIRVGLGSEFRRGSLTFKPRFSYERAQNFKGVGGNARNLFLADLSIELKLDWYFKKSF
ncbi:MAG: capsule assembly Wzi family protein [bacterium]